nr:hypothetical protein [Pseudonocardia sp. MH-G8]
MTPCKRSSAPSSATAFSKVSAHLHQQIPGVPFAGGTGQPEPMLGEVESAAVEQLERAHSIDGAQRLASGQQRGQLGEAQEGEDAVFREWIQRQLQLGDPPRVPSLPTQMLTRS